MGKIRQQDLQERVREISLRLVGWGSETGTPDEAAFAPKLAALLRSIPYFRDNPDHIRLTDSHGTPMTQNVIAVIRGQGSRTLALAGHYDVVSVDNYRELKPLAFEPENLLRALVQDLESRPLQANEQRALDDLRSGHFLPGRGMLDMKSGIAAAIAVLEAYSQTPDRQGNLVLLVTPDEERGSRGMRSLRDVLPAVMAEFGLEIEAGINLDATSDQGDGREGRAIYRGTIGKALPFGLVIGHSSHASYPFEGISAQLVASTLMRHVEGNPALCDRTGGEISPPPICLECKDLRGGYEVTTPERVWIAFNWLSHGWNPRELLHRFMDTARQAMADAIAEFNNHASAYANLLGQATAAPVAVGEVISVEQLRHRMHQRGGRQAANHIAALEARLADCDDPLQLTRTIVDHIATLAGVTGPAIIVGLGSLLYPSSHLNRSAADLAFAEAIEQARLVHEASGAAAVRYREYFTGISDMSFFGHRPDQTDAAFVAENTPATALTDMIRPDALSFPVVNIGPWGREFHQRLERVYTPYAFEELPRLLREISTRFLADR